MARPAPPVVIGIGADGTHTHVVVATTDGSVLGRGAAAGDDFGAALTAAIESAGITPVAVLGGVAAVSGTGLAGRPSAAQTVQNVWSALGLPGCPAVVAGVVAAHAAGTPRPDGLVLIAGTGAIAAAVQSGRVIAAADGLGWLLGDEGGAAFIGLAGARAAVRALDGRGPETVLVSLVLAELKIDPADTESGTVQRLVPVVEALSPEQLGRLAPLVSEAAIGQDPVARKIAEQAADRLLETLDAVRQRAIDLAGQPPVIAGSVLLSPGPVADIVSAGIFTRYGRPPTTAGDDAGGAAWLALRAVHGEQAPAGAHARVTQRTSVGGGS